MPLEINGIRIACFVLGDETRVITQGGMLRAFGRYPSPNTRRGGLAKLPAFLSAKNLSKFIPGDFGVSTNPIQFEVHPNVPLALGFDARLLPTLCGIYLRARRANVLRANQSHIAERSEILMEGMAQVGIIALIDEATGYERVREERALANILQLFIAQHEYPWTKTFPDELFEHVYRLRGWFMKQKHNYTQEMGNIINDLVYDRLAPGVLEELQRLNPKLQAGYRRSKHHQYLTRNHGYIQLQSHLASVIALMKTYNDGEWNAFKRGLDKAYPKLDTNLHLSLGGTRP